jgi:hypothetical protein
MAARSAALDGQGLSVGAHPFDKSNKPACPPAEFNESRKLQLAARSALVDHQLLRRLAGNHRARVILDES